MVSRKSLLGFVVLPLAFLALPGVSFALEPSGSAVRVERITNAAGPGGARLLVSEGPVFMGDQITTNSEGLAQIKFADDTRIVVGPNSNLVVDTFVFNPDNTARQVTVSAVKGFFRFISGKSPSEVYSIRTRAMTIGVRGTTLDIHANGPTAEVVFLQGSGFGTMPNGQTTNFETGCVLYQAQLGAGVTRPEGLNLQQILSAYFPLLQNQVDLAPEFRVNTSSCPAIDSRIFGTPASGESQTGDVDRRQSPPESNQEPPEQEEPGDDDEETPGDDDGGDCSGRCDG